MAHHRLVPFGAFCHALGSCADDIDGEVYGRGRHACSRVCDGFRGACPRYRRRVCEGRHPTNAVGTLRWTAFLDGLGGVPLPVLCPTLWRTA